MFSTMSYQHWQLNLDDDHILWLGINRADKKVNTLNHAVLEEFSTILTNLSKSKETKGVVIYSLKTTGFIAGADIEQFTKIKEVEEATALVKQAQSIFNQLAALKMRTVAMISGFCLGGGLELALACDYRIAMDAPSTKIGFPEVKLGLLPGWGGTERLPQTITASQALRLIVTGKILNAYQAKKFAVIDDAVPEREMKRAAVYFIKNKPPRHKPPFYDQFYRIKWVRSLVSRLFYKKVAEKVKKEHYPAPYRIIKNWVATGAKGRKAMDLSAQSIAELLVSKTSRNLVRAFFLQTRLKGLAKSSKFQVKWVHVIGAGVMGGDIAAFCALKGLHVTLQDVSAEKIAPAIKRAHDLFTQKLFQPRLVQAAMDRLVPDIKGGGVRKADLVIEAVVEDREVKQTIFEHIEPHLKPKALLASNTSSLSIDELSTVLKKPERLIGMHFFNPVAKMPLVEVVKGSKTSDKNLQAAMAFVGRISHLPLPVKDNPGFLINRILMPYLMEGFYLIKENIDKTIIDQAAVDFGMPMGPIELADTVGLDICYDVAKNLIKEDSKEILAILEKKIKANQLGRKTNIGFYHYENKKPIRTMTTNHSEPEDLTDRLILGMVNEAVACWHEKIVDDADLIDAGLIFGTGFAPFRGGALHYAKMRGIEAVKKRLSELAKKYGERFEPRDGWDDFISVV